MDGKGGGDGGDGRGGRSGVWGVCGVEGKVRVRVVASKRKREGGMVVGCGGGWAGCVGVADGVGG